MKGYNYHNNAFLRSNGLAFMATSTILNAKNSGILEEMNKHKLFDVWIVYIQN